MADPREFQTVVLAALLHAAGKFLQRGRSLAFDIAGPHPEVSARFVEAFADSFAPVADVDLLKTLVLHHHRSRQFAGSRADDVADPHSRLLAMLINTADGLSSSERGQHTAQWQIELLRHHPVPLATTGSADTVWSLPERLSEYQTAEPGVLTEAVSGTGTVVRADSRV